MIVLSDKTPFASGGHKLVYRHPDFADRCLKVMSPEAVIKEQRADHDPLEEEWRGAEAVCAFGNSTVSRHMPAYYGFVATDIGRALCTEIICDSDGGISPTLEKVILREGYRDSVDSAVDEFLDCFRSNFFSYDDLGLGNLLVKTLANGHQRIYYAEYAHERDRNNLFSFFRMVKRKKKAINKMRRDIESLLAGRHCLSPMSARTHDSPSGRGGHARSGRLILSLSHNAHDAAAVVADGYDILAAVQTERITRKKSDSQKFHSPTIRAAVRAAGADMADIGAVLTADVKLPYFYFRLPLLTKLRYDALLQMGRKKRIRPLLKNLGKFNQEKCLQDAGLPPQMPLFFYNHHYAHALSALFFTDWEKALLYTADGGGDTAFYSCYDFDGECPHELDGDRDAPNIPMPPNSIGLVYGAMTHALGYKINRHEGKLTGLAAFGKPEAYDEMAKWFSVRDDGRIVGHFKHPMLPELIQRTQKIAAKISPENAAASVQKLLEDVILKSIGAYLQKTGATNIGLAGGVFANVTLNRKIAELPEVREVFIFPAMTDDGIAVGGLYQFLLERDGMPVWKSMRRRLNTVYWGDNFDDSVAGVFSEGATMLSGDSADVAARLLSQNKIVALFCGRMEFGPRALGARSILASAADKQINDTLNERLARTEFMPFAPAVLAEDAADVFEVSDSNRYAMRFMTITCKVRDKWRDKIPAVVHIDGTARPQIVYAEDNTLYADILRRYKQITGLPVLVNTSFNAHEEPIIRTAEECLRALQAGRVDYVAAKSGVYESKTGEKK